MTNDKRTTSAAACTRNFGQPWVRSTQGYRLFGMTFLSNRVVRDDACPQPSGSDEGAACSSEVMMMTTYTRETHFARRPYRDLTVACADGNMKCRFGERTRGANNHSTRGIDRSFQLRDIYITGSGTILPRESISLSYSTHKEYGRRLPSFGVLHACPLSSERFAPLQYKGHCKL